MRDSQPPCQALPCPRRTPHATAWAPGALPGVACTLASWSLMLLLVLQEHLAACSRLPSCSAIMFLLHGVVLADLAAQTTTDGRGQGSEWRAPGGNVVVAKAVVGEHDL